ncbi:MAG: hypothetical protein R6W78_07420, partial [Bacteroidales bacterium]
MKKLPGILNDVIGPVMRGPSSSHTAASWRIARIALDILNEPLEKALTEFDTNGAWAPNYREQGTTMGIDGGLLGLEITDERMKVTESYAREKGIIIEYQISSFPTEHANTVRLTLWGISKKMVQIVAVSLGGGSFEIRSVNGFPVQLCGDLYEIMFFTKNKPDISDELKARGTIASRSLRLLAEARHEGLQVRQGDAVMASRRAGGRELTLLHPLQDRV